MRLRQRAGRSRALSLLVCVALACGVVAAAGPASADGDTQAPQLLEFSVTPSSVDTSTGAQSLTVTARITDDLAGVSPAMETQVRFRSPSGNQFAGAIFNARTSGGPLDGVYEATVTLPRYSEQGTWTLEWVLLKDDVGNTTFVNGPDVAALPATITFEQTGTGDSTAPTLDAFTLSTNTVDTSAADVVIDVTAQVTETESGVQWIEARFHGPSATQFQNALLTHDSGDIYTGTLTVPRYAEQGTWTLTFVDIRDNVGNQAVLHSADVAAISGSTYFDQTGIGDANAPLVTSLALDPTTTDTSGAPAVINVTAHLTDDLSGVITNTGETQVRFRSQSNGQSADAVFYTPEPGGDALSGDFVGQLSLPQFAEQGVWHLEYFITKDVAGNSRYFTPSEIANVGGTTTFINGTVTTGPVTGTLRRQGGTVTDWPAETVGVKACPGGAMPGDLTCGGAVYANVDTDGTYALDLPDGQWTLFPVTRGGGTDNVGMALMGGAVVNVYGGVPDTPVVDFTVQALVVTGTVLRPNGAPWAEGAAGVFVCGFPSFVLAPNSPVKACNGLQESVLTAPVDATGHYAIVIPVDVYPVSFVSVNAYATLNGSEVLAQQVTQFLSDATASRLFTLGAAAITGHVRDSVGNPLPGFYVSACVLPGDFSCATGVGVQTDGNGAYTKVVALTTTNASLSVWAGPNSTALANNTQYPPVTVPVLEGSTVVQDFVRSGAWVSGTVLDPSGNPAPFMGVVAKAPNDPYAGATFGSTGSIVGGTYRMFLAAGSYSLATTFFGSGAFAPGVRTGVTVPPSGELTGQDIQLSVGAQVPLSVTTPIDPAGGVQSSVAVCQRNLVEGCAGTGGSLNTDPAGNWVIPGGTLFPGLRLPLGDWRVVVTPVGRPDLAQATVDITVGPGLNPTVNVVLGDLGATVSGKVLSSSGGTVSAGGTISGGGAISGSVYVIACPNDGHYTGSTLCIGGIRANASVVDGSYQLRGLATGSYNVVAAAQTTPSTIVLSAERQITVTAGDAVTDENFIIGGPDTDGIAPEVENAGPNGGDGNFDHFADSQQSNVASLPTAVAGNPYVTIESAAGTRLSAVSASAVPSTPTPPDGAFPVGLLNYSVLVAPGAQATVKLYLPTGTNPSRVFKLESGEWVDASGYATFGTDQVVLTLRDGGNGDADGVANGVIVDPLLVGTGNVISVPDVQVIEGTANQSVVLRFSLPQPADGDVSFQYSTHDGSATDPTDYSGSANIATIADGSTFVDVPVAIVHGDTTIEPDEDFTVTIDWADNASIGQGTSTVTILNDDVAPPGSLAVTVTDPSGDPLPAVRVAVTPTNGGPSFANPTNDSGVLTFPSLVPGTYTLSVGPISGAMNPTLTRSIEILPGGATFEEFTVPFTGLRGTVTRGDNAPGATLDAVIACPVPNDPLLQGLCGPLVVATGGGGSGGFTLNLNPGTYNVAAQFATGPFGTVVAASPSTTVTVGAGQVVTCSFGTGTASGASCGATGDGDGVTESPGVDGNGDGTADEVQSNVTSLPPAVVVNSGDTFTLAAPPNTAVTDVTVIDAVPLAPPVPLPNGLIDFKVVGVAPGGTVSVDLYVPGPTMPTGYWKYRADQLPHWLDFSDHAAISAVGDGRYKVTLTLTDNGPGDDDPTPGVIRDPSGPAVVQTDHTGPSIQCPSSRPRFVLNQEGTTLTATVTDAESGPASPTVTVAAPSSGAVGVRSVSVTASDLAGNSTTVSCQYELVYQFTGFLAPVDNPPKGNLAKAGQAIPVKWRITDANGVGISDAASFVGVFSAVSDCQITSLDPVEEYVPESSTLQYLGDGNWQFNWKTPKTYSGQCRRMRVNLADGVSGRVADFQFK